MPDAKRDPPADYSRRPDLSEVALVVGLSIILLSVSAAEVTLWRVLTLGSIIWMVCPRRTNCYES